MMKLHKLIPLIILKQPATIPMYLNIFAPILGFIYFIKNLKINKIYVPIFVMIILNIIPLLLYNFNTGFIRLFQLVLFLFFSMYLIQIFQKVNPLKLFKYMIWLTLFFFIFEIMFIGDSGSRDFFGFSLSRYRGVIGEYNFTALLLSGLGLIFFISRQYKYFFYSYLMVFITAGRAAFIPLILYIIMLVVKKIIGKRVTTFLIWSYLMAILAYPLFILFVDNTIDIDIKILLNQFSSLRYQLHVAYANMGVDNILGIGYFNGKNLVVDQTLLLGLNELSNFDSALEQHNIFLEVFSEFGFIGYLLFCLFLVKIAIKAKIVSYELFASFIFFLSAFLFINGLHEVIFWIYISFILASYYKVRTYENTINNC